MKEFAGKAKFGVPPERESIKSMFNLLDVGKSGQVDLELLKYGLTSVGSDKFSGSEVDEFYNSLDINLSDTKVVSIDQMINGVMKLLLEFN